jgi:hypothetical protein
MLAHLVPNVRGATAFSEPLDDVAGEGTLERTFDFSFGDLARFAYRYSRTYRPSRVSTTVSRSSTRSVKRRSSEGSKPHACDGVAAHCEPTWHVCLMRCPSVIIATQDDLRAARACSEIDGDLVFRSQSIERIAADDLPYLEHVSGSLLAAPSGSLRELALPALQDMGTTGSDDVLEIGFDLASLERVSLPNLQRVHGSLSLVGLGALRRVDLAKLEVVDDALGLLNLPRLSALALPADVRATRLIDFAYLCRLPSHALPDPSFSEAASVRLRGVGCCTGDALDCNDATCACEPVER